VEKRVYCITGVARSGTSWLGEIIDSSPEVLYYFQPLFSYAFKGRVGYGSSREEMSHFLSELRGSQDEFLLQSEKRQSGLFPYFQKSESPPHLAFKTCRYQYLLPKLLLELPEFFLIGIVRHPCGALNSWLRNPKEFPQDADPMTEWRYGACKNQGREEEFFGFYKWKEVAHLYLDLQQKFPERAIIIRYEDLVYRTKDTVEQLFQKLHLEVGQQTRAFLEACHSKHDDNPYSVFKSREVAVAWKEQLAREIQEEIITQITGTRLEKFLSIETV